MESLLGPVLAIVAFILYVAIPLVGLWLIARGGHATRVVTAIVSAVIISIIAFMTGTNANNKSASSSFQDNFARPLQEIATELHSLLEGKEYDKAITIIQSLSECELDLSPSAGNTNTLRYLAGKLGDD